MSEGKARRIKRKARRAARRRQGLVPPRRSAVEMAEREIAKDSPAARFINVGRKEARTLLRRFAQKHGEFKVRAYRKGGACTLELMERSSRFVRNRRITARGLSWAGAWVRMRSELFARLPATKRIIRPRVDLILPDPQVARSLDARMRGARV